MKMIKILLMMTLAIEVAFSATTNYQNNNKSGQLLEGVDIPVDKIPQKKVVRDRFEIKTGKRSSAYKDTQFKQHERVKVLNEVFDPMILMTPVVRTIRSVDSIGISPAFLTQILFPHEMSITGTNVSFETALLKHSANSLLIQPKADTFFMGNVIVYLTDGKKNYMSTIFMERYYRDDCEEDKESSSYVCRRKRERSGGASGSGKYAYVYNNLSAVYQYIEPKKLGDLEALFYYEKMNRKLLNIKKEGEFVLMNYDGVLYRITRDEVNGGIMYRNKMYRVTTSRSTQATVE